MDLVELSGNYVGESYDLLKIEIETTGAYGTGTFKVHYLSNDQLFGKVTDPKLDVTNCPDNVTSCSDIPAAVPCADVIENPEG